MEVLAIESDLSRPESNLSEFLGMFTKLCLKFGCNLVGVGSFVPEKSDGHYLIILHHNRALNGF
jgi:hypothetical protein